MIASGRGGLGIFGFVCLSYDGTSDRLTLYTRRDNNSNTNSATETRYKRKQKNSNHKIGKEGVKVQ